jgi:apolipoprotein N-acyltransferase
MKPENRLSLFMAAMVIFFALCYATTDAAILQLLMMVAVAVWIMFYAIRIIFWLLNRLGGIHAK